MKMGMSIDKAIDIMEHYKEYGVFSQASGRNKAIETMRKYQKIEDIYYHQTGRALEDSLRAVIEDGKIDCHGE